MVLLDSLNVRVKCKPRFMVRFMVRLLVCAALCAFAQAIAPCAALAAERVPLDFALRGFFYDHVPFGELPTSSSQHVWWNYEPSFHDFITTSIDGPTITTSAYTAKTRQFTGTNGAVTGYFNFPLTSAGYDATSSTWENIAGGINSNSNGDYVRRGIDVWRYFDLSYMTLKHPRSDYDEPIATMVPKIPISMNGSNFTVPAVSIDVPQVASTVSTMHNNGYLDHEERDTLDYIHLKNDGSYTSTGGTHYVTFELDHSYGEYWEKGSVFEVFMPSMPAYINSYGSTPRQLTRYRWMYLDADAGGWVELTAANSTGSVSRPLPINTRCLAVVYSFSAGNAQVNDIFVKRPQFWRIDNSVEQTIERETEQQTQTLMDTSGSNTLLNGPLGTTDQIQQRLGFVGTAMEVPASIVQGLGSDAASYVTFPGFSWNGFTLPAVQVNPWTYLPELETPVKSIVTGMFVFAWFRGVRRWFGKTFLGEEEVHIDDDSEE